MPETPDFAKANGTTPPKDSWCYMHPDMAEALGFPIPAIGEVIDLAGGRQIEWVHMWDDQYTIRLGTKKGPTDA